MTLVSALQDALKRTEIRSGQRYEKQDAGISWFKTVYGYEINKAEIHEVLMRK